jgi:hypothetical protein
LVFLSIPYAVCSQTIRGKIESNYGEKILFANIVIKDSVNADGIREFVIARNGQYSISLHGTYSKITVEVTASKYMNEYFEIDSLSNKQSYIHDFILIKDQNMQLKEVVVTAKAKPFIIKDDTVKYNVAAYKDGSERKIEDIIKKLPGIEVNEKTGEITYKGKTVETVKLEGDDLFGSNYAIGTKNINVDMVEQVQAIENYTDNPLLKGIESGDKVALNLKLKKDKIDFSGNMDFGSGIADDGKTMYDASTNILGISKKYKSFGTVSYNNVGKNYSPFDYFSYNPGAEQMREADLLAKKIIPETFFLSQLDDRRANLNNAWFGNYNNLFKIGKQLSIKTNLFYLNDRITANQLFLNNNFISNQQILTSDDYNFQKKPEQYRGDVEMKYNSSKNSLIEYKLRLSQESINTSADVLQNSKTNYQTALQTKDFKFKQSLLFTQKVSEKKALQILLNYSSNNIPQNYFLSPSVYSPLVYARDNQYSDFGKIQIGVESVFLGSTKKTKYTFALGSNTEINSFQSGLTSSNNSTTNEIANFTNDFTYKKNTLYNSGNYNIAFGKWKIAPSYSMSYLQQALTNNFLAKNEKIENFIFEPSFSVKYKIDDKSGMLSTISYRQKPFSEEFLFNNPVYISNRTTINNVPELQTQKTISCGMFYLINNLYKQFQLSAGILYNKSEGNYFSNIYLQENSTRIGYFYLPKSNGNINANFLIEKYVPLLESTIRLKSGYSISNYKNIVNNSGVRNNSNKFFYAELFMKTAFDIKLNFENMVSYKRNQSQSESSGSFTNAAINNSFKIIVKPDKNWFVLLSSDYFLPGTNKTNDGYLFLDASVRFTPRNKIFELNFIARNILNNTSFIQIETTDYATTIFQSNLIPRYLMLSISYSF